MDQNGTTNIAGGTAVAESEPTSRAAVIGRQGVKDGKDFANMMSALMSDVLDGTVTPDIANAACNAGGKLLKIVEMEFKYRSVTPGERDTLSLAGRE